MYAIIRAGGKQAKVQSGDVIDIERVKGDSEELSFAPLLVVDDKGTAVSDRSVLANATVTAKVLGESQGPKIDIYKYKNKTGYSRRQGHRQKYTRIEITGIELPGAAKPKTKAAAQDRDGRSRSQGRDRPTRGAEDRGCQARGQERPSRPSRRAEAKTEAADSRQAGSKARGQGDCAQARRCQEPGQAQDAPNPATPEES